jgi:hypothetical protein
LPPVRKAINPGQKVALVNFTYSDKHGPVFLKTTGIRLELLSKNSQVLSQSELSLNQLWPRVDQRMVAVSVEKADDEESANGTASMKIPIDVILPGGRKGRIENDSSLVIRLGGSLSMQAPMRWTSKAGSMYFFNWSVNGKSYGAKNVIQLHVERDVQVVAHYLAKPTTELHEIPHRPTIIQKGSTINSFEKAAPPHAKR